MMMKYNCIGAALMLCCLAAAAPKTVASFATSNSIKFRIPQSANTLQSQECNFNSKRTSSTALQMAHGKYGNGRSSSRYAAGDRTKRQERVGHVVRTELASILHKGFIRFDNDPIEDELRRRINIVHCDVSPDLRQARVTVSVMSGKDRKMDAIAKRRAYAWLVRSTKAIRHSLAQKMKHMKGSPDLTFVQVDVGAAVDVMQLIEKVSTGYKRDDVLEMEFEDDDEDGWEDEEDWIDFDDEDGVTVEV
jgi:ribosome-binding factor A